MACAEMLLSGTTTFYDILEAPNTLPGGLDTQKDEVVSAGIRGILLGFERSGNEIGNLEFKRIYHFTKELGRPADLRMMWPTQLLHVHKNSSPKHSFSEAEQISST